MTRDDVERLVSAEAARAGVRRPAVQWTRGRFGATGLAGRTIYLPSRSLPDAERIRFTALHELGHVALGHQRVIPAGLRSLAFFLAMTLPGAVAFVLGATSGGDPSVAVLLFFLGISVGLVAAHFVARWVLHDGEFEADAWAAARGGVLTPRVAQQLTDSSASGRLLARVISTHPTPAQRLDRIEHHGQPKRPQRATA